MQTLEEEKNFVEVGLGNANAIVINRKNILRAHLLSGHFNPGLRRASKLDGVAD